MKKLAFLLVFFLFALTSANAEEYCKIGGDPVEKFKPLSTGEELYILPEDTLVDIEGKTKNYHCVLEKGTVLVVKDGVAIRAYQCGNDLITRLAIGKKTEVAEVKAEPEVEKTAPTPQPQVTNNNYYITVPQTQMVPYYYRGGGYDYNYFPRSYTVYDHNYSYSYRYRDRHDHRDRHYRSRPVRHERPHRLAPVPSQGAHPAPPSIP